MKSGGVGEMFDSGAITEGGGECATEDQWAPGQVQFIDEAGLEKGIVQAAATLDHDGADVEVAGKGNEAGVEIDGIPGGNEHLIGEQAEGLGAMGGGGSGHPEVDGGEPVLPEVCLGGERGGAGDDDADGMWSETGSDPGAGEFIAAIAQGCPGFLHGAGAAQEGIGPGAEFMEMPGIAWAAEGVD